MKSAVINPLARVTKNVIFWESGLAALLMKSGPQCKAHWLLRLDSGGGSVFTRGSRKIIGDCSDCGCKYDIIVYAHPITGVFQPFSAIFIEQ